jgi:hypothetical protein
MSEQAYADQYLAAVNEAAEYFGESDSSRTFLTEEIPDAVVRLLTRLCDQLDKSGVHKCKHSKHSPRVEFIFVSHGMYWQCEDCMRKDMARVHKAERQFGHTCWSCNRHKIQDYELFIQYRNLIITGLLCRNCMREIGYTNEDFAELDAL